MRRLVVSERAETDLREIWLYSFRTWGEAQADRYLGELDAGLRECGAEPERGKCRDGVRPGYWSRLIRRHVAFYTFTEDEVLVQRVLHGSMDPDLHLDDDDE
jgi:toxin ParE1/3/4